MDRQRDPRMRQSMLSQQDEASLQQPRLERQLFRYPFVIEPPPLLIRPDFHPNTSRFAQLNRPYHDFQGEGHYDIFVGNLGDEVTEVMLFQCFSGYRHFLGARIVRDQISSCSKGFGFASFTNQQDAESAINDLNGKLLGSRRIRCKWPSGAGAREDKYGKSVVGSSESAEDDKEMSGRAPEEDDPQNTSVYVGNLSPEVTQQDLFHHFHALGAGEVANVRIRSSKRHGFVLYRTHSEAAMAIQMVNKSPFLCGRLIKCSWAWMPNRTGMRPNLPLSTAASSSDPSLSGSALLAPFEMGAASSKMKPFLVLGSIPLPVAGTYSDQRLSGSELPVDDRQPPRSHMGGADSMQPILAVSSSDTSLSGSISLPTAGSSSEPRLSGSDLPIDRQLLTTEMGSSDSMQPIPLPAAVSSSDPSLSGSELLVDDQLLQRSRMGGANSPMQPREQRTEEQAALEHRTQEQADTEQQRTQDHAAGEQQRTHEQADMDQQRGQDQAAMEQQRTQDEAALDKQRDEDQADMVTLSMSVDFPPLTRKKTGPSLRQKRSSNVRN